MGCGLRWKHFVALSVDPGLQMLLLLLGVAVGESAEVRDS